MPFSCRHARQRPAPAPHVRIDDAADGRAPPLSERGSKPYAHSGGPPAVSWMRPTPNVDQGGRRDERGDTPGGAAGPCLAHTLLDAGHVRLLPAASFFCARPDGCSRHPRCFRVPGRCRSRRSAAHGRGAPAHSPAAARPRSARAVPAVPCFPAPDERAAVGASRRRRTGGRRGSDAGRWRLA